ncbi:MAG: dephospho-CoA kinase [Bacteroidales bacterium]|jgi:dephospho-CoA kinase|nr:dephospho-CoA kinase [Bacteroidales bacterium]
MFKVGITGNIGSGKTISCRIFEHLGVPVYYSDYEAKKHYEHQNIKDSLSVIFGKEIFTETNEVDKKQLARIVFNNVALLQELNKIIHPLVEEHFEQWHKQYANHPYILFESAVLYSCKLTHLFDKIIFVEAPAHLIIDRVIKRDNTLSDDVKQKLNIQSSSNNEDTKPDYTIINDEVHLITPQIIAIHQDLACKNKFNI